MLALPKDVQLRRPTMEDLDAVLNLMLIRDRAEYGEADMTEEHIRTFWRSPGFNIETNAWAVTTQDERMIGYASVWRPQPASIYTYLTVLPEFQGRGIRTFLLDVVERRARELLAETPSNTRVTLNTHVATVPLLECCAEELAALRQYERVAVTQLLKQICGPLDVAKEQRHGSTR